MRRPAGQKVLPALCAAALSVLSLVPAGCAPQDRPRAERIPSAPPGTWIQPESAANARLLLAAIDRAETQGLDPDRLLRPTDRLTIEQGLAPTASALERSRAESRLTAAYVAWARALQTPALSHIEIVIPDALPPPPEARRLVREAAAAPDLAAHLSALETRHPFHEALRKALVAERAGRARAAREQLLLANLERTRVLPTSGRHLVVDTGTQRLWMFDGPRLEGRMKVIVGARDTPTPTMISLVEEAVARPYWNVPEDLAQTRIAARVLRYGTQHLDQQHLKLLSGWSDDATEIAPDDVDWKAVAARRQSVRVRQEPGPWNMMGAMKFLIRNDRGIYLHDTPERALFRQTNRTLSAGCIRIENWRRLADWLFDGAAPPETALPETAYPVARPVPIYVLHLTVDPTAPDRRITDPYRNGRPTAAP